MANINNSTGKTRRAEVAGGGFAGLTAAIALRQCGWDVQLHEKGSELRAFGAGIYLWYNGLRVLEGVGALEDVLAGSHTPPVYETWLHNKSVSRETFNGLPWRIMTRAHLHDALVKRAKEVGVEIRTGSEAVAADPDGRLTLQSGEVLEADLIVGADGVGSKVRDSVGFEQDRWVSTDGIIRLIVPRMKKELGHGEWDNTIDMWNFWPRVQRILYSPCNENELYLGLMAPAADPRGSRVPLDLEVWVEMFPFLEPCLIEAAKLETARYDKYATTKLDAWSKGKVALVGDAANAMCPALAQGAGCAMVNALSLSQDLERGSSVEASLAAWEKRVRPITDRCQALSGEYAANRSLSKGNMFTPAALESASYDPLRGVFSWPQ
ncbi:MAG: FAD-dependent monooxygenase [Roseitalea sp.]|uniref:FAD-dependent monooxygenase n=1 Tax=Oceaniradius stylonematis TaxID=2184161 RepID=A0A3A8ADI1_9HYPH|nr:NAD(P)/FAD-dependent oxidoreductase [Oceaniradius stylonematis]MBO6551997.1 FAD-dependent monooxygenase [Roseitalea sp.]MBO6951623.1 FAD-dependent monooxygenase [Rhizobiaceae bacterium]RNC96098.1 MAG: FAD-dependent monooxygenase [Oricola sp.]MBO6592531.1 FAD-dependent monooxygenase [Roseitalea sp.]MBO6598786.1 FAD-dependent monooxygenase [Roseitalea sp.]